MPELSMSSGWTNMTQRCGRRSGRIAERGMLYIPPASANIVMLLNHTLNLLSVSSAPGFSFSRLPNREPATLRFFNRAQDLDQSKRVSRYSDPAMSHLSASQMSANASAYVMKQTMIVDVLNRETVSACSSASKRGVPNNDCHHGLVSCSQRTAKKRNIPR